MPAVLLLQMISAAATRRELRPKIFLYIECDLQGADVLLLASFGIRLLPDVIRDPRGVHHCLLIELSVVIPPLKVRLKDLLRLIQHVGVVADQEFVELVAGLGAHKHGLAVDLGEEGENAGFEAENYCDEVEGAAHEENDEYGGDTHVVLIQVYREVYSLNNQRLSSV